ncbi:response regulator, partial [Pseudomonas sp. 2822-17]|uniref:response regulator n=1 Tax=Pseudomonas sp. 2822-17 TaxID=1712678 RepID=UPI00117BD61D
TKSLESNVGLELTFKNHGFDTYCSNNARTALRKLQSLNVDIIVVELELPDMNGLDFCRELRVNGNWTPIIIISSKSDELE